jgi:hypothetical protein
LQIAAMAALISSATKSSTVAASVSAANASGDATGDSIQVQTDHGRFLVTHLRRLFNGDSIFANGPVFGFDSRARAKRR